MTRICRTDEVNKMVPQCIHVAGDVTVGKVLDGFQRRQVDKHCFDVGGLVLVLYSIHCVVCTAHVATCQNHVSAVQRQCSRRLKPCSNELEFYTEFVRAIVVINHDQNCIILQKCPIHTHTHSVLTAIFPGEPGLAGCPLNSPSPFIPGLRIL